MEIGYLGMLARDLVEAHVAPRPRPRSARRGGLPALRGRTATLLHRFAWVVEPPWRP